MRIFSLILLLWMAPAAMALADPAPTPAEVGVRLEKRAGDGQHFSQGSGVFLGDGLVLTAAHVVDVNPDDPKITVVVDGWRIDGAVVQDGQAETEKLDLALVKIDQSVLSERRRAQPAVPVCAANPGPSQPVVVASLGTVTQAATISTPITSDGQTGDWTNLLSTGYHHGNSGGGVFSPGRGCLWGIINLELSGPVEGRFVDLTAFIPATKIAPFLSLYRTRPNGGR